MRFLQFLLLLLPTLAWAGEVEDFMAARAAFAAGQADKLNVMAQRLQNSPFEPYVTYYQLRMRWDEADSTPIRAFFARVEDTPVIDQFRGEWLKHMAKRQRWEVFVAEYPNLVETDAELTCYALQWQRKEDEGKALLGARALWFTDAVQTENCMPLFEAAIQRGFITAHNVQRRMQLFLESGKTSQARKLNHQLPQAERWPVAELDAAARNPQRYLHKTSFVSASNGRRAVALFALQRLARRSVNLAYAEWQRIVGNFAEGERLYAFAALGYAAALEHDERALGWYEAAGDAELNEKQLAWRVRAALRAENWYEVSVGINAMPPQQRNETAWRYWKARALQALGRTEEAQALLVPLSHEYHYYGQLAAEELGAAPVAGRQAEKFEPNEREVEEMQARPEVRRTILLYRMGLRVEAAKEWDWAMGGLDDRELLAAAEVAQRNKMFDRSISAAMRTVELHDFNLRYPAPYREALQSPLQEHDLEEAWVYGLMRQESRFVTQAKSEVGAAGLMQVMPETARWAARRLGLKGYRKGMIQQLDMNLRLGTYYMKNVYSRFDDSPVLASAAYNAGPTRARKWRGNRPLEGAIYVETIPFDETRDYVRKVMSNTLYYAKLFGHPTESLKQRLGVIDSKVPAVAANER
ncbi:MAG: transglycosylase SLT domain-containing protein [Sideroxyarcus sp.]|nr:transglycosylase SLT domain-containing protein [Sideroxyarcus sp.]